MKQKPGPRSKQAQKVTTDQAVATLLLTLADTSWRIFVPVILGTVIGIWSDLQLNTAPWLTFIGVGLGFAGAFLLIRQQLRKVAETEKK